MKWTTFLPLALMLVGCAARDVDEDSEGIESQLVSNNYVALGDSYASGLGTREYTDDGCKRSNHAYGPQLASAKGLNLTFVACSGARIPDVRNQLGSLNSNTGLVTVSVGGNDAGFADVITKCAGPWPTNCNGDIDKANNFIKNTLPGQLDGLYNDIRAKAPNAVVIVVGYPRIFNGETCNALARISADEQSRLNATADLLATTIKGRASAHSFKFVDARTPFNGHAVCDDTEWINGLSNPISESYHPNRAGHDTFTNLVSGLF
ncbi:SGNH/GDSL hydrolase family protein [Pendulispora rubella]|uniref:SGNH/GDSL hydrolase family protein n=1 Tax=Pendulispora rubella TaxID=2741070 RepID=A0ABZ2LAV4_9BACT